MLERLDLPLTGQLAEVITWVLLAVALAFAAWIPGKLRSVVLRVMVGVGIVTALVWVVLEKLWAPFSGGSPIGLYLVGWLFICTLILLFVRRKNPVISTVVMALVVALSLNVINISFAMYPSAQALVGREPFDRADYSTVAAKKPTVAIPVNEVIADSWNGKPRRENGLLVNYHIPTPVSHFSSMDSQVYLPPAYFANPRPLLPVLVLLNGLPGSTDQWFNEGQAGTILHNFERQHDGLAPVVVTVDATGNGTEDLGCFNTTQNKVQTFLDTDVPRGIQQAFQVDPDPTRWAIGGLSYGGTCSLQVVTVNPEPYRYFLDFSGDRTPGEMDAKKNADTYFGGNMEEYKKNNPEDILHNRTFPGISGQFVVGNQDVESVRGLRVLNDLANKAGMHTGFSMVPGSHDFGAWRAALEKTLPDMAQATGLID